MFQTHLDKKKSKRRSFTTVFHRENPTATHPGVQPVARKSLGFFPRACAFRFYGRNFFTELEWPKIKPGKKYFFKMKPFWALSSDWPIFLFWGTYQHTLERLRTNRAPLRGICVGLCFKKFCFKNLGRHLRSIVSRFWHKMSSSAYSSVTEMQRPTKTMAGTARCRTS